MFLKSVQLFLESLLVRSLFSRAPGNPTSLFLSVSNSIPVSESKYWPAIPVSQVNYQSHKLINQLIASVTKPLLQRTEDRSIHYWCSLNDIVTVIYENLPHLLRKLLREWKVPIHIHICYFYSFFTIRPTYFSGEAFFLSLVVKCSAEYTPIALKYLIDG